MLGTLTEGVAVFAFGLLDSISGTTPFFVCSILIRILEGTGMAVTYVSLIGTVPGEFGEKAQYCYVSTTHIGLSFLES